MSTAFSRLELQRIAKDHRLLLWSILAGLIAILVRFLIGDELTSWILYLAAGIFQVVALYKLGRSLKLSIVWMTLLVIGLFIPLLGLLILLLVHDKAMKAMKSAGVPVGFMGADPNSIE
ncbi:hypothetical protein AMR42_02675 [Limnothrix sp. PR1529]|jgi:hypothetical protein|nr:hypothetical protein BCR12_07930 [Limnothrix sp. P13C2]PIB15048.1 hypothetical protein AMR42_02675 [Limnothrix sp. PR1529]